MAEKYYWLKLKKDFFKRHDITIIEAMPNGKDYILFYLKLLCESIDHNGLLRFNETIPYSEEMLATLTRTNLDVVRSAMKVFVNLQMIEVLDDETIFMAEVDKMLGTETYWAEKKRQQRIGHCPTDVQSMSTASPTCPTKSKSKSKSIEIEIDIDKESIDDSCESTPTPKSTKHKYGQFSNVLLTEEEHQKLTEQPNGQKAIDFLSSYIEEKGYKAKSHYLSILRWVFKAVEEREAKNKQINSNQSVLDPLKEAYKKIKEQDNAD